MVEWKFQMIETIVLSYWMLVLYMGFVIFLLFFSELK